MNTATQIILTVLGSGALFSFLQYLLTRYDKKHDRVSELEKRLEECLDEREKTGTGRYEEHREAIEELRKAILALTKDAEDRKKLEGYIADSLMALTHDKIVYLGKCYQKRGAITLAERNNLTLLFTPYHDGLGGNSDGEGYYTFCMNLPVVTDETAAKMDKESKQLNK